MHSGVLVHVTNEDNTKVCYILFKISKCLSLSILLLFEHICINIMYFIVKCFITPGRFQLLLLLMRRQNNFPEHGNRKE